jgi:hypothetical protein
MSTRLRLLHEWTRQVQTLLPGVHATRAATLALFSVGIVWSGVVTLLKIAAALPLPARDVSLERRLRRFLANPRVSVATLWRPLLPRLLATVAQGEVLFVFDPTPLHGRWNLLVLGVVVHGRILPVAWRVMPLQEPWPQPLRAVLQELLTEAAAALPPGVTPTLLGDRGLVGPGFLLAAQAVGWHVVLRLHVGGNDQSRVLRADGTEQRLADLPTAPGQRWHEPAAIFKDDGWHAGHLTIHWARTAREPWVLFSDRPGGTARVREYRRRAVAEATYGDLKSRGFGLQRSKIARPERLERLLLVLHLALWWSFGLGLRTIRAGQRHRFDRRDRRDLSLVRLGQTAARDALLHENRHPLPFRHTPTGWRYAWSP